MIETTRTKKLKTLKTKNKIIETGEWDGEKIWTEETARERFSAALTEQFQQKKEDIIRLQGSNMEHRDE